jgi:hypothetical protein
MNACKGKVLFKDLTIAIRALKKMNRRDSALQIYKCEDCKGYHIGSFIGDHVMVKPRPNLTKVKEVVKLVEITI